MKINNSLKYEANYDYVCILNDKGEIEDILTSEEISNLLNSLSQQNEALKDENCMLRKLANEPSLKEKECFVCFKNNGRLYHYIKGNLDFFNEILGIDENGNGLTLLNITATFNSKNEIIILEEK